jgi:hypothetical protein
MIARICTILMWLTLCASAVPPTWPAASFSEVRAYSYNATGYKAPPIIKDGKLHATTINTNGTLLATNQVKHLLAAITGEHFEHPVAGCFKPRHAFVFYGSDKKPVAQVLLCFECMQKRATPEGTAIFCDWTSLANLCRELKLPNSPTPDFGKWLNNRSR